VAYVPDQKCHVPVTSWNMHSPAIVAAMAISNDWPGTCKKSAIGIWTPLLPGRARCARLAQNGQCRAGFHRCLSPPPIRSVARIALAGGSLKEAFEAAVPLRQQIRRLCNL